MAQSVERRIGSAEVTGPIPVSSLETESSVDHDRIKVYTIFCFSKIRFSERKRNGICYRFVTVCCEGINEQF